MTTQGDGDAGLDPQQKEEAERKARQARRRAKRLMAEAQNWEEHSASDGRLPPPEGGPGKRQDVMKVAAEQDKTAAQTPDDTDGAAPAAPANLPAPRREQSVAKVEPGDTGKGGTTTSTIDPREAEIREIQRELVQRRRRRFVLLWLRLAFFVMLPTFLVGNYYYRHATPFYATEANMLLEASSASLNAPSAAGATAAANVIRASIAVQDFLVSREALRILDQELGVIAHYADPAIDPIQRLPADASENEVYAFYKDRVLVGFDITEGVLRLEVIAATPDMAYAMANRLIELAEERVVTMSDRNQQNAVASARAALTDAEVQLDTAYERVLGLQEQLGIFSADIEVGLVQGQISSLTSALEERRLSLAALQDNARPNQAQVRVLNAEIARLEEAIAEQRSLIVNEQSSADRESLARVSADLARAEQQLATRELMVGAAIEGLEIARREAAQQSLFFARAVNPVLPVVPSYPRAFEYTALAFVIFFATYMMVSLTISILREQMSYGD
ncbi:capsule biosynthesis protein [Roseobacter sp. HKCCA0434]|uniref:capsule biosynthesis protein n=1 Tax=Roseobacter sp. HKCCA0434 TaxID=3079297 RepID=UPI0029059FDF|nr:capsule biosynthesis protein [Roseobacter sp. HKCCA0434]